MLSISALADDDRGCGDRDVLQMGIFETEESVLKFPAGQDTNIDSLVVGNDRALAYGSIFQKTPKATATNNLEIKKAQRLGDCGNCCPVTQEWNGKASGDEIPETSSFSSCKDCCIKINLDQIKVGNRDALAFGFAAATNNVQILATQE